MSGISLPGTVAEGFNRHGSFTARVVEHGLAVEIRIADTGDVAALLWIPDDYDWVWTVGRDTTHPRTLPRRSGVEQVVRAVATSVLDERAVRAPQAAS